VFSAAYGGTYSSAGNDMRGVAFGPKPMSHGRQFDYGSSMVEEIT